MLWTAFVGELAAATPFSSSLKPVATSALVSALRFFPRLTLSSICLTPFLTPLLLDLRLAGMGLGAGVGVVGTEYSEIVGAVGVVRLGWCTGGFERVRNGIGELGNC